MIFGMNTTTEAGFFKDTRKLNALCVCHARKKCMLVSHHTSEINQVIVPKLGISNEI